MALGPEIDIPVSKLLSFETVAKSLRVSVSENLVSEKRVLVSVSKKFGLGKKSRFRKIWSQKNSIGFGFGKICSRKKVSVSVSEKLVSEKSLGFGKFGLGKEKI